MRHDILRLKSDADKVGDRSGEWGEESDRGQEGMTRMKTSSKENEYNYNSKIISREIFCDDIKYISPDHGLSSAWQHVGQRTT